MRIQVLAEQVEHFMHGDELDALQIPMRLLGQESEVDCVGDARVQKIDRNGFGVRC